MVENLDTVSDELRVKIDGGGVGGGADGVGSGSSRVVALNQALAVIKKEIREYHISSSVLSARLTAVRCQEQASALEQQRLKAQRSTGKYSRQKAVK